MTMLRISSVTVLAIALALSSAFAPKMAPFAFTYEVYKLPSGAPDQGIPTGEFIGQNDLLSAWYQTQDLGIVCNFEQDDTSCLAKVRHDDTLGPDVIVELLPGKFQD